MAQFLYKRLPLMWRTAQTITVHRNHGIYTRTGGMKPEPRRLRFPVPRVLCTVLPPLSLGMYVAKKLAYYLDEYDWFTPDED